MVYDSRASCIGSKKERGHSTLMIELIQTDKYVVAVEVEMVVSVDDLTEPCYESETVQFLRDIKEYAVRGDVTWLTEHGRVYAAMEPA